MGLQQFVQRHRRSAAGLGLIILAAAVMVISMGRGGPPPGNGNAWYFDLDTAGLFQAPLSLLPPVDTPAGGTERGVRAYIYSCDSCADEVQRFVLYLESFTPEARAVLRELTGEPDDALRYERIAAQGRRIAAPPAEGESPKWFTIASSEGQALNQQLRSRCGENRPRQCLP